MENEDVEEIKKARKVLEDLSADERTRYLAEQRLIQIMDKHAIEGAGFDKGREYEKKRNTQEIAKKLKAENINIDIICKVTGLPEEEVKKL